MTQTQAALLLLILSTGFFVVTRSMYSLAETIKDISLHRSKDDED